MTDKELEVLWLEFGNVPLNEDEEIETPFHIFDVGTDKETIWQYFDEEHSKGVHCLMFGDQEC